LPFTGGALAKLAIKDPLGEKTAALLVGWSAVGTMLLMLRFLFLATRQRRPEPRAGAPFAYLLSLAATAMAAFVVPWLLFSPLLGQPPEHVTSPEGLWEELWPLLAALAIGSMAWCLGRLPFHAPVGDIVVVGEPVVKRLARVRRRGAARHAVPSGWRGVARRAGLAAEALERRISGWSASGTAVLVVAVLLALALVP
jgi:hypothetical protein